MFTARQWPNFDLTFKGEHFESFASVVLRVPGLMLIDQWSHISSDRLWPKNSDLTEACYAFVFNLSIIEKFLFRPGAKFFLFVTVLIQGLVILILPLPKLVTLYMHYLSLAALTAASLLSRHYVLTESTEQEKEPASAKSTGPASPTSQATQLPSIINFSPEYALKFAREFR